MAMVRRDGFTLIELLVVISVIGILVSIITSGFTTGQKRSRDAKRRADLAAIQQSLEQCFTLNSAYPAAVSSGAALTCGTETTMNFVPEDPKGTDDYIYNYTPTAKLDGYCLCALLEQEGAGNSSDGSNCNYNGGDYQCLNNQQ